MKNTFFMLKSSWKKVFSGEKLFFFRHNFHFAAYFFFKKVFLAQFKSWKADLDTLQI